LFADDIKLFLRIITVDDCKLLQHGLNAVAHWARGLGLELSIPKSYHDLHSFLRTHHVCIYCYDIAFKQSGDCVMDLDITIDRSLTFQNHIEKVNCKSLKHSILLK
jgi:hypothetical protein